MMNSLSAVFSNAARTGRTRAPAFQSRPQQIRACLNVPSIYARLYSADAAQAVEPPDYLSENEKRVFERIKEGLQPSKLEVQDISGGCGSMYALDIVSDQFKGLPIIKQHRLVNSVLGEEMKAWHGVQMKTKAPGAE